MIQKIPPKPPEQIPTDKPEIKLRHNFLLLDHFMGDTTMNKVLNFLKAKYNDLSTYVGIILLSVLGLSPEVAAAVQDFLPELIGLLLVLMPRKTEAPAENG